jgi:signal transduction histidine kinase
MYSFNDIYKYSKELTVLYVEDDMAMLNSSSDIFDSYFVRVDTAMDGRAGLEKYTAYKKETAQFYDLIITDIHMPIMDGLEMIQHIKKINRGQNIIVISAHDDSSELISLLREGVSNFITKPINSNQLLNTLYKSSYEIYNEKMKNEFIISQSKLVSMGEMIDGIAHQWLTPITLIQAHSERLEMDIEDGILKKQSVIECISKQSIQIEHLIETLNEFRSFFKPSNKIEICKFESLLNATLVLLKEKLILHSINVELSSSDNIQIQVVPNEFKHVLINIINNAIYEFHDRKIKNPKLIIESYLEKKHVILEIVDNAGGISKDVIGKIFQNNFTTKKDHGSGMGLYLVQLILEKINAKIEVENVLHGTKFTIKLHRV